MTRTGTVQVIETKTTEKKTAPNKHTHNSGVVKNYNWRAKQAPPPPPTRGIKMGVGSVHGCMSSPYD